MLACAIGECNIDVFIKVVEATGKGNDFKVLYIYVLMDLTNGDLVAAVAIYCAVKRAVCSMAHYITFSYDTEHAKDNSVSFKYADTGSKLKAEYESSIMNKNQVVELSN